MSSMPASLPPFDVACKLPPVSLGRSYKCGEKARLARTQSTIAKLFTPRIFAGLRLHCPDNVRLEFSSNMRLGHIQHQREACRAFDQSECSVPGLRRLSWGLFPRRNQFARIKWDNNESRLGMKGIIQQEEQPYLHIQAIRVRVLLDCCLTLSSATPRCQFTNIGNSSAEATSRTCGSTYSAQCGLHADQS